MNSSFTYNNTKFFYPASKGSEDITQTATDIYGLTATSGPGPNTNAPVQGTIGGIQTPGGIVTGLPGS